MKGAQLISNMNEKLKEWQSSQLFDLEVRAGFLVNGLTVRPRDFLLQSLAYFGKNMLKADFLESHVFSWSLKSS